MPGRVFIHATNVHQGGGRSLLAALLKVLHDKAEYVLSLDERMTVPMDMPYNVKIKRVKPSVVQRLDAERWLAQSVAPEDIVLCFGNLPPLFKLRGHTVVFVQNRYLIDDVKLNGFPLRVRLRLVIERLWLSRKMSNANEFVVQTPTMKRLLEIKTRGRVAVRVLPFVSEPIGFARAVLQSKAQKENDFDFVYVASGEPHKNHRTLLEAWRLLAQEGLRPSLALTLSARDEALKDEVVAACRQDALQVKDLGHMSHQEVLTLYGRTGALIFPSTFESFGLPLIEAAQLGLPILASELDFVRDVCVPIQSFDPQSPVSIARAVKRFLCHSDPTVDLHTPAEFWRALLGGQSDRLVG